MSSVLVSQVQDSFHASQLHFHNGKGYIEQLAEMAVNLNSFVGYGEPQPSAAAEYT